MKTINVAILTDGWNRFATMSSLDGMFERAKERGISLFVTQLASFGEWCREDAFNAGEYSVFSITDYRDFDVLLLDVSDMSPKDVDNRILPIVRKLNIPVLAIDSKFAGIKSFGQNNHKSISEMMDHLYNHHGIRSFAFFGGPSSNYEATVRAQAYTDSLLRFHLNSYENPFYPGSFQYDSGVSNMKRLLNERGKLPQAIVCANDTIAIGAIEEAKKHGYECPRDFVITGFDNYGQAERYSPQITTVAIDRIAAGKKITDIICDLVDDKPVDEYNYIDGELIFRESCGCGSENDLNYRHYAKQSVLDDIESETKSNYLTSMMAELSMQKDFHGFFSVLSGSKWCKYSAAFSVVVDEAIFKPGKYRLSTKKIPIDREKVAFLYENGERVSVDSTKDMMRRLTKDSDNKVVFISGLHFGANIVGYLVIKQDAGDIHIPDFADARNRLIFAADSLYQTLMYSDLSNKLSDLYNTDQLTNIHNRIFYDEEMVPTYEKIVSKRKKCAVFFVDVDNFKVLNDTHGHTYGDKVLKNIAKTVKDLLPSDGECCRYGGDEFVAIFPYGEEDDAYDYASKVEEALSKKDISVSVGIAFSQPGLSLSKAVDLADKSMYRHKFLKFGDRRQGERN